MALYSRIYGQMESSIPLPINDSAGSRLRDSRHRRPHGSANARPLLASEVQLADACKLELPMRPDSAHDSSRRVCLSVGSQIKMADLVNHGRAKDHFGVGPLAFGDLIDHRIKDVYALNSALRRVTVLRETTQADVTVYLADSGGGSVAAYKSSSPATLTPVGGCFTGIRRPLCLFDSSCRYELRSRCSDSVSALQYKGRIAD